MKKVFVVFLLALILLNVASTFASDPAWCECQYFGCAYGGAACWDDGIKMFGSCWWILCIDGGSISCHNPSQ